MARCNKAINSHLIIFMLMMFVCFRQSSGHGRLLEPPGRSSMWRFRAEFPDAPTHFDDNGLNCGGRSYQHESVGGRCGVCGDKWHRDSAPAPNEAGGMYANGVITRHYKRHDVIDVTIEVTASHKGYFEFRICPVNDKTVAATHSCLNKHLLRLEDGSDRFYYGHRAGRYHMRVQLPVNLTCSQCVFQWRWRTGNSWGYDPSGRGCVGCGPQEEFYGCSDVSIDDIGAAPQPPAAGDATTSATSHVMTTKGPTEKTTTPATTKGPNEKTTTPATTKGSTEKTTTPATTKGPTEKTTTPATTKGPTEKTTTPAYHVTKDNKHTTSRDESNEITMPGTKGNGQYEPVGIWKSVPGMTSWCNSNCVMGYCPKSCCMPKGSGPDTSNPRCHAANEWLGQAAMDVWCQTSCDAGNCPSSHCACN